MDSQSAAPEKRKLTPVSKLPNNCEEHREESTGGFDCSVEHCNKLILCRSKTSLPCALKQLEGRSKYNK